jgi:hypothetical protein
MLPKLTQHAETIEGDISDYYDAERSFNEYKLAIEVFEGLFEGDEEAPQLLEMAQEAMDAATKRAKTKYPEPDLSWTGDDLEPDSPKSHALSRSIFSDVAD